MTYPIQHLHQPLLRAIALGIFFFTFSSSLWSQNIGINVDGSDPDPSAILDVKSSDKGLLIPRMSSLQRANIPAPAPGLMVYDLTTQSFWFYSSGWEEVLSGILDDGDWTVSGNDIYSLNGHFAIGRADAEPFRFRLYEQSPSNSAYFNKIDFLSNNLSAPAIDVQTKPTGGGVAIKVHEGGTYNLQDHIALEATTALGNSLTRIGYYDSNEGEYFGVFSRMNSLFSSYYAASFEGRVRIGETPSTRYTLPIAGGTAGQVLTMGSSGNTSWFTLPPDQVDDADADPDNEIQDLSLSGTTLSLTGDGSSVDLSSITGDDGDWAIAGNDMYSANSGYIGIGTNNPDNKLHLQRDDMGQIAMQLEGKRNTIASSVVESASNTGLSVNCCSAASWIGSSTAASGIGSGEWVGGQVGNNEQSDFLHLEFSFSSTIPATATITGIKMDVYRKASDNSNIYDQEIRLINNGTAVGVNKALMTLSDDWPLNYAYQNYGNNTDLWSYGGWTPTLVNAGNLGIRIQYEGDIGVFSSDEQGFVDFVRATVYYENVTGEVSSIWTIGSLDGDFKINNQSNLSGTTELRIGQDGVTELQGLRIPTGGVSGRVLTSGTDGTASWQAVPNDGDGSSTNEIQSLNYSGTTLSLSNSNSVNLSGLIDDADADPNNEIQLLSLSGSTLTLTGDATPVDLSSLLGDDGDWTVSGNTIYTSNYYSSNCRVGIGTNNPRSTLYVKGELILEHLDGVTQDIRGRGYYTEGPTLAFSRSDTDTFGNQYAPHLGQELGEICFRGRVGSSSVDTVFLEGAKIVSTVVGHFNTARSAKLTFHTRPPNASDLEERMVISDLGKVGIGTDSPSELLHVNGSFRLSNGTEAFGRVLTSDVNGTASWQSLPTDGDSNSSNELQNIIAGTGLTGGGSSTTVSLNVMGSNGLTSTADDIKLGGTLSESTVISAAAFDLGVNLTGTGEFSIRDAGNPMFTAQSDGVMVFNENGLANQDVRMESNSFTHMFVMDAGLNRVGIKENTPEADLHITSDGNGTFPQLKLEETAGTDGARLIFTNSVETTNQWTLYGKADDTASDSKFNIFHSGPGNIIQVVGEGRVGIRQANPTFTLQLPSSAGLGEARAQSWTTYSDKRIKRNIRTLGYGLDEVLQLRPSSYMQLSSDFEDGKLILSEEGAQENIGFIAQELYKVVPEAAMPPRNEDTELWGVDYTRLIPVLTKAIQEQQDQIEALQAEVEALKSQQ